MSFKQFGGLTFAAKNNIIGNLYSTTGNLGISSSLGQENSKIISQSHVDLSGNSLMHIGSLYFMDGSVQTAAMQTSPSGAAIFNSGIIVYNGSSLNGGATIDTLHVTGTSQLDGAVTMGSTLGVTGLVTTIALTASGLITANLGLTSTAGTTALGTTTIANGTSLTLTGTATLTTNTGLTTIGSGGLTAYGLILANGGLTSTAGATALGATTIATGTSLTLTGTATLTTNTGLATIGSGGLSVINSGTLFSVSGTTGDTVIGPTSGTSPTALKVNGKCTATTFESSSDYRIKEDVTVLDETFNVDKLRPVTYTNKNTEKQDIGFIAHEVQQEFPYLVSGEKDGEQMQSLNYIGLIGVLVKEIQELKKRVQILENK